MRWNFVAACSIGTSHKENGEVCQDNCYANVISLPNGKEFFLGIVSDGAGSSSHGAHGSEITCNEIKNLIEEWLSQIETINSFEKNIAEDWVQSARKKVLNAAEENNLSSREYACTLICALVGSDFSLFFQLGDGVVIKREKEILVPVFWPENGEYFNTTYFITDDDALNHLQIVFADSFSNDIAILSDGLQMLSLNYESKSVHQPFFEPMFKHLRSVDCDACIELNDQLESFLNSPSINERTSDDKTLILATHIESKEIIE